MRHKHTRMNVARLLLSAGALAVLLCLWLTIAPGVRSWRVERAIRRFETAPSQAGADRLMELLDRGHVTTKQGERVLRSLLRPKITTRPAYPVGQPVGISSELPFRLYSPRGRMQLIQSIEGEQVPPSGSNTLTMVPYIHVLTMHDLPQEPDIHRVGIRCNCTLTYRRYMTSVWNRIRTYTIVRILRRPRLLIWRPQSKTYQCGFTVPVEINVAEEDAAERLELVSGSEIDQAMRGVISATAQDVRHGAYDTPSGRRGYRGSTVLTYDAPPVAVAWQVLLRLADGRVLPEGQGSEPQRLRLRAVSCGVFMVDTGSFGIEEPGEYSGTLVLRPDPNHAYEDPAIKSLWNGTLEFPLHFVIYDRPQAR